ncbi:hypothetical protein RJ639_005691 [Escallonia herrerae]|uniref:ubiquitinyl hydrolase 1 n=1 Tax=Escallonia herrerae TaxID=1293975 RepID=A0AA89AXR8_9ASTE|nr:hypothetical protein RJ639_005691 [Escallonia herrerae]
MLTLFCLPFHLSNGGLAGDQVALNDPSDRIISVYPDQRLPKIRKSDFVKEINMYNRSNIPASQSFYEHRKICLVAPRQLVLMVESGEDASGYEILLNATSIAAVPLVFRNDLDPNPEYNLFATIVHSGFSPDSGHYYAYIKDVMGRWYCCNDSYVSLSTLQEVLSEKVYILFFSRTKQRPVLTKTALTTNGTKSYDSNLNGTFRIPKAVPTKTSVDTRPFAEHHPEMDKSTTLKDDKVPSNPQTKLSRPGSSGTKKLPGIANFKIVLQKRDSNKENGHVKASISKEKSENNKPLSENRNGVCTNNSAGAVDSEKTQSSLLVNGKGKFQSVNVSSLVADHCEDNGAGSKATKGRGPSCQELHNGSVNGVSDNSGSKRKIWQDSCILFAEDAQSHAKLMEFKEAIGKEASSVLKSCGWADEVYTFMHSRKKKCAAAGNDASNINEIKKLLIADAKPTFISQIPESLKGNLIQRLRTFSQENQCSSPLPSPDICCWGLSCGVVSVVLDDDVLPMEISSTSEQLGGMSTSVSLANVSISHH